MKLIFAFTFITCLSSLLTLTKIYGRDKSDPNYFQEMELAGEIDYNDPIYRWGNPIQIYTYY